MSLLVGFVIDFRVENHLGYAGPVTEVDKDQSAMISTGIYPPGQVYFFSDIKGGQGPAVMGSLPDGFGCYQGVLLNA
jgi:hypothetical protein